MTTKLEIKPDAYYWTRGGEKAHVWKLVASERYPWFGEVDGIPVVWANDGKCLERRDDPCDLVAEWHELPEGFTPWFGGDQPVDDNVLVEVVLRYGGKDKRKAPCWRWYHYGDSLDIIGYRVVEDKPTLPDVLTINGVRYVREGSE